MPILKPNYLWGGIFLLKSGDLCFERQFYGYIGENPSEEQVQLNAIQCAPSNCNHSAPPGHCHIHQLFEKGAGTSICLNLC